MGKKYTVRVNADLPIEVVRWVDAMAEKDYGGNRTRAIRYLLDEIKKIKEKGIK